MLKLFELIKKNFKLLVRAKVSALVIFIGPLLLVSLLGLAYSQSSTFTLTASVYSDSYNELTESLLTKMENQNFRVLRQTDPNTCISDVKRKEAQACIIFPADMELSDEETSELTFYVDYSQINLVWLMIDVMSARVSERSEEISKEITSDILGRMIFVDEKIKEAQASSDTIKSASSRVTNSSSTMSTGFKRLDISVDFSGVNIDSPLNESDRIADLMARIDDTAENMTSMIEHEIDIIENSVGDAQSGLNDSDVLAELDDIDDAADEIELALENATEAIEGDAANATMKIGMIRSAFIEISGKLSETQTKISSVKKKRDDLMPKFDSLSSDIDKILSEIVILQSSLKSAGDRIAAIKGKTVDSIVAPIETKIEPITTQKTHFNSLFPTLLVLIITITGILLASTLTMVEKKSKAFFRNRFTPTSYFMFSIATYMTSLIVLFIQLLLFVSVSAFFFETEVISSLGLLLLLVFLASTVFISIGMFIGFIFRTEETSNLAAITLIAVFLLFSNAVIPLESLPSYLKDIALFSPFVMGEMAIKQALLFEFGIAKVTETLGLLAGYAAGIFIILLLLQHVLRRLSFADFSRPAVVKVPKLHKEKKAETAAERPNKINTLKTKARSILSNIRLLKMKKKEPKEESKPGMKPSTKK